MVIFDEDEWLMNIKGKKILIILLIIMLLIFSMIYFRPLSLLEKVNESNQIRIVMTEFVYKGGNPGINSTQYAPLSSEQNQEFLAILKKYPYRRTILTPFSDGSMPNGGNQLLNLFLYENTEDVGIIFISSQGKISIDSKNYRIKNSDVLIQEVVEFLNESGIEEINR